MGALRRRRARDVGPARPRSLTLGAEVHGWAGDVRPGRRPGADPGWLVHERRASAAELVTELGEPGNRRILSFCHPTDAALILGSTQALEAADTGRLAATGTSLVRRRSGGGAVYVAPGAQVWVDVFLPPDDPLLERDVGRSAWWLGRRWADALVAADARGAGPGHPVYEVHQGALLASRWGRTACFAGRGPGEVHASGRKVVGIAQRRTRSGTWLHSMALVNHEPVRLADLLALTAQERAELARELAEQVQILASPPGDVRDALVAQFA